jgi:hypothetical protein
MCRLQAIHSRYTVFLMLFFARLSTENVDNSYIDYHIIARGPRQYAVFCCVSITLTTHITLITSFTLITL